MSRAQVGDTAIYKGIQREVTDTVDDVCLCEIGRDCKNCTLPNVDAVELSGIGWVPEGEVVIIPAEDDDEDEEEDEEDEEAPACPLCGKRHGVGVCEVVATACVEIIPSRGVMPGYVEFGFDRQSLLEQLKVKLMESMVEIPLLLDKDDKD